jgi:hypothetical protein
MSAPVKKIVVIMCQLDENGKVISNSNPAPYGYHHIQKVYDDNSFWMIGTISSEIAEEKVSAIAKLIAGDLPVEIDADFYTK